MNIIPLLTKQKSIFFLGCKGYERYEMFRSFPFSTSVQNWWPKREEQSPTYTYVLYSNIAEDIYVEDINGNTRLYNSKRLKEEEIHIVFLPVKPSVLPNGSVLVIPPPIEHNQIPSVVTSGKWTNSLTQFVWVEAFPYGKSESFNALELLKSEKYIEILRLQICFIKSGRKFAYSDLDGEDQAIENAESTYKQRGYIGEMVTISIPLSHENLSFLFINNTIYHEELLHRKAEEIEDRKRYFELFFEDEYKDEVTHLELIQKLENIFSYQKFKREKSETPFVSWMLQLEIVLISPFNEQLTELLQYYILPVHTDDSLSELNHFLERQWSELRRKLGVYEKMAPVLSARIEAIDYEVSIADVRIKMKQEMNTFIEELLLHRIKRFVDEGYRKWNPLLRKYDKERV